uniref:Uncharacterized protein n=1 Tax=Setaria italica TaxID=4555 RepID=K4AK06_SETIT
MEFCEATTLESEGKDSLDKHGSFILEIPQEPCMFNVSLESATLCVSSTRRDYNHLKVETKKNNGQVMPKKMGATSTTTP